MKFTRFPNLVGKHAPFSASRSSWLRYSDEKAIDYLYSLSAAERGTRLHAWAQETIDLGIKQKKTKSTLENYVNDAIGFKMDTEVTLYYSDNFFGTADSICFRNGVLRIHDLKTGVVGKIEDHIEQLEVYAALFCLQYKIKPGEISMELRVYKNDEVLVHKPEASDILPIMDKIVHLDKIIDNLKYEEE